MIFAQTGVPIGLSRAGAKSLTLDSGACVSFFTRRLALTLSLVVPLLGVATAAGPAPQETSPDPRRVAASDRQSAGSNPASATSSPSASSENSSGEPSPISDPENVAATAHTAATDQAEQQRTSLNLLGQTDANSGESRRNENVQFDLVNNNGSRNSTFGWEPPLRSCGSFKSIRVTSAPSSARSRPRLSTRGGGQALTFTESGYPLYSSWRTGAWQ